MNGQRNNGLTNRQKIRILENKNEYLVHLREVAEDTAEKAVAERDAMVKAYEMWLAALCLRYGEVCDDGSRKLTFTNDDIAGATGQIDMDILYDQEEQRYTIVRRDEV